MSETKVEINFNAISGMQLLRDICKELKVPSQIMYTATEPSVPKAYKWVKRARKIGRMNSHRFLYGHNRIIEKQLKAVRIWL